MARALVKPQIWHNWQSMDRYEAAFGKSSAPLADYVPSMGEREIAVSTTLPLALGSSASGGVSVTYEVSPERILPYAVSEVMPPRMSASNVDKKSTLRPQSDDKRATSPGLSSAVIAGGVTVSRPK